MNSLLLAPSKRAVSSPPTTTINVTQIFNNLKQKKTSRVRLNINRSYYWSNTATANDKYLLYASGNFLSLIDTEGHEHLNVKQDFTIDDICWSSYLNQFLVLSQNDKAIYSLDITTSRREPYAQVKKLSRTNRYNTCTCYQETFLVGGETLIEEYKLSNWRLIRTFQPQSHDDDFDYAPRLPSISEMRFNSSGTHVGVVTNTGPMYYEDECHYYFELRSRDNLMKVLKTIDIGGYDKTPHLLSIPTEQFLITSAKNNSLLLIDSNCKSTVIPYQPIEWIQSIALFNDNKCLVIKSEKQLHIHDV